MVSFVRNVVVGERNIYKRIPKKVIEEKQLDLLLENPQEYLGGKNKYLYPKRLPFT
jgi:hypothetical protein